MLFLHLSRVSRAQPRSDGRADWHGVERHATMLESELRSILFELTTAPAEVTALEADLHSTLRWLAEAVGCRTDLRLQPGVWQALPNRIRRVILRVAQEAVNNIARHAAASPKTSITLKRVSRSLRFVVENEGGSVADDTSSGSRAPQDQSGFGLRNMRERLLTVDGTLRAKRLPDGGFRIVASIPLTSPSS